ncbi:MAG: DUF1552 domain-containing protein [Planctomycetota bacterium]|nr:MAG: DUF1552 domain-containing protein [Planctomycetota bacterium]
MALSPLSRRTLLRGFGTALSLPLLQAMLPARGAARPRRLAYLYVPNGAHMPDWTPAEAGALAELPHILQPLQPLGRSVSVLSGLAHDKARPNGDGPGDHARAAAAFLTGVQPLKTDGQVRLGPSADQVAAAALGDATPFRSLVLGCEAGGNSGECDSGYSCAYSSNISWISPTVPAGKEINPRLVFDRLFRGGEDAESAQARARRAARRQSVLDFVRDDAAALQRRLGADDRAKLAEYTEGVRALERRIARAAQPRGDEVPDAARPAGIPDDYGEHLRLMLDLLVLAFQTDSTRVASLMFANEGSNRPYPMLQISGGHHEISHHDKDPLKQRQIRDINRFHVEQLAYFLGRLDQAREPEGSLLDSAMIVYGSAIGDGNAHNHDNLPVLLCGRGGGSLHPGSHRRYPADTPMNNLHLALLAELGVPEPALGDGTAPLSGL